MTETIFNSLTIKMVILIFLTAIAFGFWKRDVIAFMFMILLLMLFWTALIFFTFIK